jgi:hypothetical protein
VFYFDEVAYRVACARKRIRTMKQAAAAIGLSASYLGHIVRGTIPPESTRQKIAARLGVAVADLWKPQPGAAA